MTQAMARTTLRAAAYNNPNRPGTHLPRKMAPHRPSFLIHCPELDADLTCTKQTAGHVSNRQFFAFLKLPDTASACRAGGVIPVPTRNQKQIPHTVRQTRAIGFGMTDITRGDVATHVSRGRSKQRPYEGQRQSGVEPPHSERKAPRSQIEHGAPGRSLTPFARSGRAGSG